MDHINIIKRAWKITWNYKILWIFGFFIALTGSGVSGNRGIDFNDRTNSLFGKGQFNLPGITQSIESALAVILPLAFALICLGVILSIVVTVAQYVSRTAMIRMVDQYEIEETKLSFKEGVRLGWSKGAIRIFLMDLIVGLVGFFVFAFLFIIAALPLLVWLVENNVLRTIGTIAAIGLILLVVFFAILVGVVVSLILQFANRVCILEERGVFEALREGFAMVRNRLGDTFLIVLILFGIKLAFGIVLIPVALLLLFVFALLGGLPWVIASKLVTVSAGSIVPMLIGFAVIVPLFILVVIIPTSIISSVYETFISSVWTLTFREFRSLDQPQITDETEDQNLPSVSLPEPEIG